MGEEGVADYLSAIAAACDRVSRLEPCRSTGHGMMDSVYVQPRMAFVGLMKKVVAAGAAGGAGEAVKGEEVGEYGGMDGKYDSSVQNLLAMCAAEAL